MASDLDQKELPAQMDRARWPEMKQRFAAAFNGPASSMVRTRVPPRCSRPLKRPNMNTTGPEHRFEKRPAYCTRDLPPRFSRTNLEPASDPPFSGEHSDAVLRGFGFEFEEIAALRRSKALA